MAFLSKAAKAPAPALEPAPEGAAPVTPAPAPAPALPFGLAPKVAGRSYLSSDLTITGEMVSTGAVELHGELDGNARAGDLTIGDEGRLKGRISAENVEVRGKVSGKISCAKLGLRASAEVKADVNYQELTIDSGAQVGGKFLRPKAPGGEAGKPAKEKPILTALPNPSESGAA